MSGPRHVLGYVARLIEDANATETFDEMIAAWMRESGASRAAIDAAHERSRSAFERAGLVGSARRREKAARKRAERRLAPTLGLVLDAGALDHPNWQLEYGLPARNPLGVAAR